MQEVDDLRQQVSTLQGQVDQGGEMLDDEMRARNEAEKKMAELEVRVCFACF